MSDEIIIKQVQSCLQIGFNRPDKRNAIKQVMYADMAQAIEQAASNNEVRSVLIHGVPGCFTAGNDLEDFAKAGLSVEEDIPVFQFMRALRDCPVPVVAAVDGMAVGIGTTLLLHCDIVLASEQADFSMPFVKLGLCPEYAASVLLAERVGQALAREWLLLGRNIPAQEALSAGLINRICEAPLAEAEALCLQQLHKLPPSALKESKRLLKSTSAAQVETIMQKEIEQFSKALQGPEFAEAVAAFFEKREPNF